MPRSTEAEEGFLKREVGEDFTEEVDLGRPGFYSLRKSRMSTASQKHKVRLPCNV